MAKPLSRVFWKVLKSTGTPHPLGGGFVNCTHKCVYPKNHDSHFNCRGLAEEFAIKMASKHPDSRYYVLECVFGVVYNPGTLEPVFHR